MYVHTYFVNFANMLVFNWSSFTTGLVIEFYASC
jgi:hypothetical protein